MFIVKPGAAGKSLREGHALAPPPFCDRGDPFIDFGVDGEFAVVLDCREPRLTAR